MYLVCTSCTSASTVTDPVHVAVAVKVHDHVNVNVAVEVWRPSALLVIRLAPQNREAPIDLLEQDDPRQTVGQGDPAERAGHFSGNRKFG